MQISQNFQSFSFRICYAVILLCLLAFTPRSFKYTQSSNFHSPTQCQRKHPTWTLFSMMLRFSTCHLIPKSYCIDSLNILAIKWTPNAIQGIFVLFHVWFGSFQTPMGLTAEPTHSANVCESVWLLVVMVWCKSAGIVNLMNLLLCKFLHKIHKVLLELQAIQYSHIFCSDLVYV